MDQRFYMEIKAQLLDFLFNFLQALFIFEVERIFSCFSVPGDHDGADTILYLCIHINFHIFCLITYYDLF